MPLGGSGSGAYWVNIGATPGGGSYNLIYLGLVATAAVISLQTWGQRHGAANEAAVIYAFEPAAAAFFRLFLAGETITARGWVGAGLLISGMIVSHWNTERRPEGALVPE